MFRVSTVLLTSKGEPLLWPDLITDYLGRLQDYEVPFTELQTSGIRFQQDRERLEDALHIWRNTGLTTVSLSVVHYENEMNQRIYTPKKQYPDLATTIKMIRAYNLSVRLNCMLVKDFIDTPEKVCQLLSFAQENDVAQVTIRPITASTGSMPDKRAEEVRDWTLGNTPTVIQLLDIVEYFEKEAVFLRSLPHGAKIFDYKGQNLCVTNCLTLEPNDEQLRQIIWFPDGRISYDWRYPGARLL
jgi:molybdenum cofactor biosynthesis enzyme MoaA